MQFCALSLDSNRVNIVGSYSVRKDETIVIELGQKLTRDFLDKQCAKNIHRIRIHTTNHQTTAKVYRGPYRMSEQHGILIFEPTRP